MSITRPDRVERGVLLSAQGHVAQLGPDQWAVKSVSDQATTYNVTPQACDCPDSKKGQSICKHQWASAGYVAAFIILALRKAISVTHANRILEPGAAIIASLPIGYRRTLDDEYRLAVKRISATTGDKSDKPATDSTTAHNPESSPKRAVQASAPILIRKECNHAECLTTRCARDVRVGGIAI